MIGPQIDPESFSWSIELNGIESISLKLRKSTLPNLPLNFWLAPWWAGVVLSYNGTPIVAGPIITRPSESADFVTIGCGGIRTILAKRLVINEYSDWTPLAKSYKYWSGMSLGTIAKRVVSQAQAKSGGSLPISYALPDELVANGGADHERTYRGFNLQNVNAHDVLNKLSNVIGGPDIMFKPKLINDNQLTFVMWTGTDRQPRIYQQKTAVWDTTPSRGFVVDMSTISTGSYQSFRTFSTGAGQDAGLLIKVATNEGPLQAQFPLLETVVNVGNSENPKVVADHGLSNLWANKEPLLEVQMTIRADGVVPLGEFWPGDLVQVITQGWLSLPDGMTEMRLLSVVGDSSNNIKVSLQKEDKFVTT
jgi:hypothetical protein